MIHNCWQRFLARKRGEEDGGGKVKAVAAEPFVTSTPVNGVRHDTWLVFDFFRRDFSSHTFLPRSTFLGWYITIFWKEMSNRQSNRIDNRSINYTWSKRRNTYIYAYISGDIKGFWIASERSLIQTSMTNSNSSSLSRVWLRANCCRCGDTRQDTVNNNLKDETPLREETETLLHRIAFTVWHTALHIESEVRGLLPLLVQSSCARSRIFPHE